MPETVLLVDDDRSLCRVMEHALQQAGYKVLVGYSAETGLDMFLRHRPSLIITDVQMPGISGFELQAEVRKLDPSAMFVFITGYSAISEAVSAIKAGAYDYLCKPFSNELLVFTVTKAFRYRDSQIAPHQVAPTGATEQNNVPIIGKSQVMRTLLQQVEKVAVSQASVLLCGESGTGKELIACTLHQASQRAEQPFVAINCAAIPKGLLESELFGHNKGAFTGAVKNRTGKFGRADKGTLFLDEIGELPIDLQPKLLRALQEKEIEPIGGVPKKVDVRVIAATNRNIEEGLRTGLFREDLYYRLAVIPIDLPPLRERIEDIPLLVEFFLNKLTNCKKIRFSDEALQLMQGYDWPGNIRELQNVVEQTIILRHSNRIEKQDLPPHIAKDLHLLNKPFKLPEEGFPLDELEKSAIQQALIMGYGNKTKAAHLLKISRHTLNYRIEKYNLAK